MKQCGQALDVLYAIQYNTSADCYVRDVHFYYYVTGVPIILAKSQIN